MTASARPAGPGTYCNPVYNQSFPDPFVLKFGGHYFAYCTGHWKDGSVFGVLRSSDLVDWQEVGGAMKPLESDAPFYWAPEVTYHGGKFYLYYSVGNETLMEVRVAISDRPDSGFADVGSRLTFEEFAIDPHVFIDRDGTRYMFYATDFLEHTHIGTGTVVDRMLDWDKLEGSPRPVTRAKYDWQVYDPARKEKGGVRWHTVEGPFVLERKGRYFEMFSGGNWQNTTYGVSFAKSNSVLADDEWDQYSDGEKVLPILKTVPDRIIGPGHNSVVRGPNNRELYCVYHRWTEVGRVLAIDRIDFAGDRLFIVGATDSPQPAPFRPRVSGPMDELADRPYFEIDGKWSFENSEAICELSENSSLTCSTPESFLCEVNFRCIKFINGGAVGIRLDSEEGIICDLSILPNARQAAITWSEGAGTREEVFDLGDFVLGASHSLRLDVDRGMARIAMDGREFPFEGPLLRSCSRLSLFCTAGNAAFSDFTLTEGFEERFEGQFEPAESAWNMISGEMELSAGELTVAPSGGHTAAFERIQDCLDFELAINIRLVENFGDCIYGVRMMADDAASERATIDVRGRTLEFTAGDKAASSELPTDFEPAEFSQLRILKIGDSATFFLDGNALGNVPAAGRRRGFGVFCENGRIALDMVRLTAV